MTRLIIRRLLIIPVALIMVHFATFAYAQLAAQVQRGSNPYGSNTDTLPPIGEQYLNYLQDSILNGLGPLPGQLRTVNEAIAETLPNSLGLLLIAVTLSVVVGMFLGLAAVKTNPPGIAPWLAPISAIGLSTPGFFLGTIALAASIYYMLQNGQYATFPIPLAGFGWDLHLVLPVLALMVRPTAQIAQATASLLSTEMGKQYIVASRAFGNSWGRIRRKQALKNVIAPVILTIASNFRLITAELVLVEWLFSWPGIGQMLARALIPPNIATPGGVIGSGNTFLFPPLLTSLIVIFTLIFLLSDTVATLMAQSIDPRLQASSSDEVKNA